MQVNGSKRTLVSKRGRIGLRVVDALQPGEQVWDTDLKGFVVRRFGTAKTYGLKVRVAGRQRWVTIGEHGVFTPDQARKEAQRLRGEIAGGSDPASERDRIRTLPTIAEFAKTFLAEHVEQKLKPRSQVEYRRLIAKHLTPKLGKLRIDALGDGDVARLHTSLRSTIYEANHVVAVLSKLLSFAEKRGMRAKGTNPCRGFERYRESKRERFLTSEEFGRLADALDSTEADGKVSPYVIEALRLLTFTGCRKSEVVTLKWDYVDFERKILFLPDSKTGQKAVHLSPPALAILARLPRLADNPYCFPGGRADHEDKGRSDGQHVKDLMVPWSAIRKLAGLDDVRIHDLRHSFASVAAARGGSLLLIGKLVGHKHAATTARYAHLTADPAQDLNNQTGAAIAAAMGMNRNKPTAEVVPMVRGKR